MGQDCMTASDGASRPASYKPIGISLAVASGLFIGVSFVLKKMGLLKANVKYHEEAGEGYGYLKNVWWWTGMTLMIIGEICNFVAYSFTDAILVTPLGALSVVITTILSAIFLKERLSFVGKIGCFGCIIGSVIILLNAPEQSSVATIQQMQCFVISPGFLTYAGILVLGCAFIAFWAGPRYGKKSMLVYLSVCSLIGGLSVVCTQGLGAAILSQINGTDTTQFKHWFLYILLVFVVCTLLTEIVFLNKALNIFNAALVTPTYYVYFTSATIVTSAILFRGFHGTPIQITTIVLGFLVICSGVVLLQLSKSAKDVPDSQVFAGDLDQVRTVAEQEEHESEPKADAIRGTAAILRSFSKRKAEREATEAARVHHDRLEPIGENEMVEWDGLRRRKTVLEPGQSTPKRTKTVHPPLGLTRVPSAETYTTDQTDDPERDRHPHAGLFTFHGLGGRGKKASTVLNPLGTKRKQRDFSGTSIVASDISDSDTKNPYAMSAIRRDVSGSSANSAPSFDSGGDLGTGAHVFGLPPGLQHDDVDTSYHSPRSQHIQFADQRPGTSSTAGPPPTPPPHGGSGAGKRTFSFQNVFGSRSSRDVPPSSDGPPRSPLSPPALESARSFFNRRTGKDGVSEEERLGLVSGDAGSNENTPEKHGTGRGIRDISSDDDDEASDEFENIGMKDFATPKGFHSRSGSSGEGSDRGPGGRGALV